MKKYICALILIFAITAFSQANAFERPGNRTRPTPAARQGTSGNFPSISPAQQANIQKLAGDLQAIKGKSSITPEMKQQLSKDLNYVLNSANISDEQIQKVVGDVETILKASNVSKQDIQTIKSDLLAISAELKK